MAELSRRAFLGVAAACGAALTVGDPARLEAAGRLGSRWGRRLVVAEPWARIERVAEGVWAVVSDMGRDRTTFCNGAIVQGRKRTMLVDAYATTKGAGWVAEQAQQLTGRWPADVVITHMHFDHVDGMAAFGGNGRPAARIHATDATVAAVKKVEEGKSAGPDRTKLAVLEGAVRIDASRPSVLDLGGPKCTLIPLRGHTASDVVVEVEDRDVIVAGDLVQNGAFPWYGNAVPSAFAPSLRSLRRSRETRYITGHGEPGGPEVLERYIALVELIEQTARDAHARGEPAAETARRFVVPASLGITGAPPMAVQTAFKAWEKELSGAAAS